MNIKMSGAALAIGAAAMFSMTPVFADASSAAPMVQCQGANACKGQSSCKTAENACKGQNACKGKGVTLLSAEDCSKAGGTVVPSTDKPAE